MCLGRCCLHVGLGNVTLTPPPRPNWEGVGRLLRFFMLLEYLKAAHYRHIATLRKLPYDCREDRGYNMSKPVYSTQL